MRTYVAPEATRVSRTRSYAVATMLDPARDQELWAAAEEGAELMSEGEYDAAISELSRVVVALPENHYALFFLGSALLEVGQTGRALKAFVSALALQPDYPGALIGAGWALHTLGRYGEAIRVGRQVLAKSKHDPDALYLLGLCHYARDDRAAALDYLTRFVATRPEIEVAMEADAVIRVLRGEAQEHDDNHEEES